ncbi:MAG: hypothetical protein Q4G30_10095 [Actinomycetaceae bacterium]|nr:hypothetical protein [Actinomycetaceae bacterium]
MMDGNLENPTLVIALPRIHPSPLGMNIISKAASALSDNGMLTVVIYTSGNDKLSATMRWLHPKFWVSLLPVGDELHRLAAELDISLLDLTETGEDAKANNPYASLALYVGELQAQCARARGSTGVVYVEQDGIDRLYSGVQYQGLVEACETYRIPMVGKLVTPMNPFEVAAQLIHSSRSNR